MIRGTIITTTSITSTKPLVPLKSLTTTATATTTAVTTTAMITATTSPRPSRGTTSRASSNNALTSEIASPPTATRLPPTTSLVAAAEAGEMELQEWEVDSQTRGKVPAMTNLGATDSKLQTHPNNKFG